MGLDTRDFFLCYTRPVIMLKVNSIFLNLFPFLDLYQRGTKCNPTSEMFGLDLVKVQIMYHFLPRICLEAILPFFKFQNGLNHIRETCMCDMASDWYTIQILVFQICYFSLPPHNLFLLLDMKDVLSGKNKSN